MYSIKLSLLIYSKQIFSGLLPELFGKGCYEVVNISHTWISYVVILAQESSASSIIHSKLYPSSEKILCSNVRTRHPTSLPGYEGRSGRRLVQRISDNTQRW